MSPAAVFAAVAVALYVAHHLADFFVQMDTWAQRKALPTWAGRMACTWHVLTYVATQAAVLLIVAAVLDMPLPAWPTAAALAVSGLTHWIIDRRWPIRMVADALGKGGFYRAGHCPCGSGAFALDQAAHMALSVLIPALLIAAL